jgi:hypothetical protein
MAAAQRLVLVVPRMMPFRLTGFFCIATCAAVGILVRVDVCPEDGSTAQQSRIVRMKMKLRFKVITSWMRHAARTDGSLNTLEYTGGESEVFVRKQDVIVITKNSDYLYSLEMR